VAMADVLHYSRLELPDIRRHARERGLNVRLAEPIVAES
jgi:hypothetical protein